jgi:type II secretory pathway pseudopilin PulG
MVRAHVDRSDGMTIIELVIIIAIMLVLATIAMRAVFRTRLSANEASAVATLRIIAGAQLHYSIACGSGGFAPSLGRLGIPVPGGDKAFLDASLAQDPNVIKTGYRFETKPGAGARPLTRDCHGLQTQSAFYTSAVPLSDEQGTRSFALNQGAQVWVSGTVAPPREPFGPPSWVLR